MDLDLLAESESDDESIHSNQDNVSVQRSAVTMATAGSDAGKKSSGKLFFLQGLHLLLSLVVRKPGFGVFEQVPHKLGCTAIEDG